MKKRRFLLVGLSPQDPFAPGLSDFERGWATHIVYDAHTTEMARRELDSLLPEAWQAEDWRWPDQIRSTDRI
jgi:hypothetical protein